MTNDTESQLPTCQFGGCTAPAPEFMHHRPNNWHRQTCITHRLDFVAGSVRMDVDDLCAAWDAGTLKVSRPLCGTVEL